jgi:U3 small nucleolar RNA-associated protein 13
MRTQTILSSLNHSIFAEKHQSSKRRKHSDGDGGDSASAGAVVTFHNDNIVKHNNNVQYKLVHTIPIYEQIESMILLQRMNLNTGQSECVVATAGSKGRVRLWNVSDGKFNLLFEQPLIEAFGEQRGGYTCLRYNNKHFVTNLPSTIESNKVRANSIGDGDTLIVADIEHNLSFLRLTPSLDPMDQMGHTLLSVDRTIVGHNDEIMDLKYIPRPLSTSEVEEQRQVLVATNSAIVKIFNIHNFSCQLLDKHTATVLCVDLLVLAGIS